MRSSSLISRALLLAALTLLLACNDREPTAPAVAIQMAKSADVAVTGTQPEIARRGTEVTVQVFGSGFAPGARAVWALKGDTSYAATRVRTNTTAYISPTELSANITIGDDATLALYDVIVLSSGKKGIGIELFEITYMIMDLGYLPTTTSKRDATSVPKSVGSALSTPATPDNVQVVGYSTTGCCNGYIAMSWQNGKMVGLPAPLSSEATGVSDAGVIVGKVNTSGSVFMYAPGDLSVRALPLLSGHTNGSVNGISRNGTYMAGKSGGRAVVWSGGGSIVHDLGVTGWATAVSENGTVVALASGAPAAAPAVFTLMGTTWQGDTLPGATATPNDISPNAQWIVARTVTDQGVGWRWTGTEWAMYELPTLVGASKTEPVGVDDQGRIVGYVTILKPQSGGANHPVMWVFDGSGFSIKTLPLPARFSESGAASAINGTGQISGYGAGPRGTRALLWILQQEHADQVLNHGAFPGGNEEETDA